MGFDPVQGPNTYGSGCMPGARRQFAWWKDHFDAGDLGCYNPASLGGKSLHAEGRAFDIQLNAHNPDERVRGDQILTLAVDNYQLFGVQEILWRGYIWSYQRRSEGIRFGVQQADHESHVHLGIDVEAAKNWTEERVKHLHIPGQTNPEDLDMTGDELEVHVIHALEEALAKSNKVKLLNARIILDTLKSPEGQEAIRNAVKG